MNDIGIWIILGFLILFGFWLMFGYTLHNQIEYVEIATYTPRQQQPEYCQKIPCCLHQTFTSTNLPHTMAARIHSWIDMNPEYDHHYYTNTMCLQYLKDHYSAEVVEAYQLLIPGAAKADLFRYCVLYEEGGVYSDIAMRPLQPLRNIIQPLDDAVIVLDISRGPTDQNLYNAFIAVTPKHPLLKRTIDMAVEKIHSRNSTNIFLLTGPTLFSQAYATGVNVPALREWKHQHIHNNGWGQVRLYQHRPGYVGHIIETKYRWYNRDRKLLAGLHYGQLNKRGYMLKRKLEFEELPIISQYEHIPPYILQTWKDRYVTDNMYEAVNTWRQQHLSYTYSFFDDDRCEHVIQDYATSQNQPECLQAFTKLQAGAFKADLWRLCALYRYGGFYVDIDMVCKQSIDYLHDYDLVICRDLQTNRFYNAFIGAKPGLAIIKSCIDHIVHNILHRQYELSQLQVTGPDAFTHILKQLSCFQNMSVITLGDHTTDYITADARSLKIKVLEHSHNHIKDSTNNQRLIQVKYSNYDDERLILGGNDYAKLWQQRKVFA